MNRTYLYGIGSRPRRPGCGKWQLILGSVLAFVLLSGGYAEGATFTVNDTADAPDSSPFDHQCVSTLGTCTLRAAIMQANAFGGADTVSVPAGSYDLGIPGASENAGLSGDLDVLAPVAIVGAGAGVTRIDGSGLDRVIHFSTEAAGSSISHLTITGGQAPSGEAGGGVYSLANPLTVEHLIIRENSAADYVGGGISAAALADNVTFIRDSVVEANHAKVGGGIQIAGGTHLVLERSLVFDNEATNGSGGGILGLSGNAGATISQSAIVGNVASREGGGIAAWQHLYDEWELFNVTVSGNQSGKAGGGILTHDGFSAEHLTVAGNVAGTEGGGIYNISSQYAYEDPGMLRGSIISNNSAPAGPDCFGQLQSWGYNVIGDISGCGLTLGQTDAPLGAQPALGPLLGPNLPYHPIGFQSAAKDLVAAPCLSVDQIGTTRPQGPACDAGAAEVVVNPDAPVALDDEYANLPQGAISVAPSGVLANDWDPNGMPITAQLESVDPLAGAVTLNADGGFLFVPSGFGFATQQFSYRASNGTLVSNVATVTLSRKQYPYVPPAVLEVPEIPWLFPGPYQLDCLAVWDEGMLASQIAGDGVWNARESGWSGGARVVELEGWIEDYRGDRYTITGTYDGQILEGSVLRPDRRIVPLYGEVSESCNALTSAEG